MTCGKKCAKAFVFVAAVLLVLAAVCIIYVADYYHADTAAIEAFSEDISIPQQDLRSNATAYVPANPTAGFVFYPGGKVEHTAYEPLMLACAKQGILCILMEMPGNLAVLDASAADGVQDFFPQIHDWYIGGHSLGGSMAASYIADHADRYRGLILLAAYSTADLSDTSLDVLSVYGSEDMVLNAESYSKNKVNLPLSFTEIEIDGGCHAYFGMYGEQSGDGIPSITNEAQITVTADYIAEFIKISGLAGDFSFPKTPN